MTCGPRLLSIGTAVPSESLRQNEIADHAIKVACRTPKVTPTSAAMASNPDPRVVRRLRALYRRGGVQERGSALLSADQSLAGFFDPDLPNGPTTSQRLSIYRSCAGDLAIKAASQALEKCGSGAESISHVVTASCTGFDAPGIDIQLIHALGLPSSVRRTHVGFMGCHAAINALATATAFAAESPDARVLVCCVELCSLHFSYDQQEGRQVANALFADGAASAIVGACSSGEGLNAPLISGFASTIIPDTQDLMHWAIGDHGFEMCLGTTVPDVLARSVPAWLSEFLGMNDLSVDDVHSWAIHPGGPRILSSLTEAIGLPDGSDRASRDVLGKHGNMSSATVLFIIDRLLDSYRLERPTCPLVATAFGPGLAGEAMLLT